MIMISQQQPSLKRDRIFLVLLSLSGVFDVLTLTCVLCISFGVLCRLKWAFLSLLTVIYATYLFL